MKSRWIGVMLTGLCVLVAQAPGAKPLSTPRVATGESLGKSELVKEGKDLFFEVGSMVKPALDAAERLEREGISLAVVNARFAKPLDEEVILKYARPGGVIITAEEGVLDGGFGSAVREYLDSEKRFDLRFKSIGIPLDIYPIGKAEQIKRKFDLDADGLYKQVRDFYNPK